MDSLKYLMAWVLMPLMAIRHKIRGVSHFEIRSEKHNVFEFCNAVEANVAWDVLIDLSRYGDWMEMYEVKKSGDERRIYSIKW